MSDAHDGFSARQDWLRRRSSYSADEIRTMSPAELSAVAAKVLAGEYGEDGSAAKSETEGESGGSASSLAAASGSRDDRGTDADGSGYTENIGVLKQMNDHDDPRDETREPPVFAMSSDDDGRDDGPPVFAPNRDSR